MLNQVQHDGVLTNPELFRTIKSKGKIRGNDALHRILILISRIKCQKRRDSNPGPKERQPKALQVARGHGNHAGKGVLSRRGLPPAVLREAGDQASVPCAVGRVGEAAPALSEERVFVLGCLVEELCPPQKVTAVFSQVQR